MYFSKNLSHFCTTLSKNSVSKEIPSQINDFKVLKISRTVLPHTHPFVLKPENSMVNHLLNTHVGLQLAFFVFLFRLFLEEALLPKTPLLTFTFLQIDVHIPTMLQFYCTDKLYEKEKNKLTSTTLLKDSLCKNVYSVIMLIKSVV